MQIKTNDLTNPVFMLAMLLMKWLIDLCSHPPLVSAKQHQNKIEESSDDWPFPVATDTISRLFALSRHASAFHTQLTRSYLFREILSIPDFIPQTNGRKRRLTVIPIMICA